MRHATHCPRCGGRVFYRIDKLRTPGVAEGEFQDLGLTGRWVWRRDPERRVSHRARIFVGLEAWVCRECGYTELYTNDLEELAGLAEHDDAVTVVDRSSGDGPFR